jgi:hypothetical protein
VQRKPKALYRERLPVGQRLGVNRPAQAGSEKAGALRGGEITAAALSGVIRVRMRDDRPTHGLPGIDMKIGIPAVQPGFRGFKHSLIFS